jgi:signal transduction histidine kinase
VADAMPGDAQQGRRTFDPQTLKFLSQLAHELRTPLTGVKGSIGVVLANEPPGTSDAIRRMFQTIDAAADRMEHMIGNVSELVRLQGDQFELYREESDLATLVDQAVERAGVDGQLRGHPFAIDRSGGPIIAWVDPVRTDRAIRNLVAAAAKLLAAEGTVQVAMRKLDSQVTISIAAELPVSTNGREGPTPLNPAACEERNGLELAVAASIVEHHGGKLGVESTPNGGIAFQVLVPVGDPTDVVDAKKQVGAIGA